MPVVGLFDADFLLRSFGLLYRCVHLFVTYSGGQEFEHKRYILKHRLTTVIVNRFKWNLATRATRYTSIIGTLNLIRIDSEWFRIAVYSQCLLIACILKLVVAIVEGGYRNRSFGQRSIDDDGLFIWKDVKPLLDDRPILGIDFDDLQFVQGIEAVDDPEFNIIFPKRCRFHQKSIFFKTWASTNKFHTCQKWCIWDRDEAAWRTWWRIATEEMWISWIEVIYKI